MISQHLLRIRSVAVDEIIAQQNLLLPAESWTRQKQNIHSSFSREQGWQDIALTHAHEDGQIIQDYLQRVFFLACDYRKNRDPKSLELAIGVLEYWYKVNPRNWNWWWNQIGKQRLLGPVALLLAPVLPPQLKQKIQADLPQQVSMTGANKADLAHGVAFRALLSGDEVLFQTAMYAIADTIAVTEEEGIQTDYSFQQHGPQLQNGGYGESFINVALPWAYVTMNTRFSFPFSLRQLLAEYFLGGTVWMNRHGYWDYNTCGRAIAKPDLEKKQSPVFLLIQAKMLRAISPRHAKLMDKYIEHLDGESYPFSGFKHFWCSDYAVAACKKYTLTVKANSVRTNPIESGNQENLLGFWLGFGSMNVSITGKEYRNIYPCWDWRRVPGVTNPKVQMPAYEWGRAEQQTHWTGGVSNGKWGVFTFELDVQNTKGLKSWFFFDGLVVALGAGISSTHEKEVVTTLNQCHFENRLCLDGKKWLGYANEKVDSWVHHGDVGYVLHEQSAQLKCESRASDWNRINKNLSKSQVICEIFELSISHGCSPENASYCYTLLPGATVQETLQYAKKTVAKVLVNTHGLQAVRYGTQISCVFYRPGELEAGERVKIEVDTPCVLTLDIEHSELHLSIATPGRGETVKVLIDRDGEKHTLLTQTYSDKARLGKSVSYNITC